MKKESRHVSAQYYSETGGARLDVSAGGRKPHSTRIMMKPEPSEADRCALANMKSDPALLANDYFDYSRVIVKKPWGYEYLIFQNDFVAVWILYIRHGFQTSMHCHPGKKSSITILSGEAVCSTLEEEVARHPGDVVLIGKAVFHRTASLSGDGIFVMEIETPVNKRDLVRFKDDYGREGLGYESIEHVSLDLNNYNYTSIIEPTVYYNVKKRFGNCSIQLCRFVTPEGLWDGLGASASDTVSILKGRVLNGNGEVILDVGDTLDREGLERHDSLRIDGDVEAIIVRNTDTLVRLADFVVSHLKKRSVNNIFFVPSTSNAHLIDAIGRETDVLALSLETEHAVALAAESYAKLTGKPGVVVIASGASGTNALTGIANAWVDSTPLVVISGQPRSSDLGVPGESPIRQLANKELDIVSIVRPITKYATVVRDPYAIRAELDRALAVSTERRAGPVWLDIPIDILGMNIDEADLISLELPGRPDRERDRAFELEQKVLETLELLKASRRPVILAGHGIRAAGAQQQFIRLAEVLGVPVLTSRRGVDLLAEDFPFYFGRPGTYGQRAANFIIQNADLLICIGARLALPLIGRNYCAFARAAKKVIVDIDAQELQKVTVRADLVINVDAGEFIRELRRHLSDGTNFEHQEWIDRSRRWRSTYPPNLEYHHRQTPGVNPYHFVEVLSGSLKATDVVVVDGGPSLDYVMQSFKVKAGQRIVSSPGLEHSGFAIPGSIGACLASRGQRIVCLGETKGLQLNIPELQTIVNNQLPVKIFVFSSRGNLIVRQVQAAYFGGRYIGSGSGGLLGSRNITKLGEAYEISTDVIARAADVADKIESVLSTTGPVLCEVSVPEGQELIPRLLLTVKPDGRWISKPLEDMYPFLDQRELRENMIIGVLDED